MRAQRAVLAATDAVCGALGLLRQPLSADELIGQAKRATGLWTFGDVRFTEPLQRFLDNCVAESDLSLVGRIATRWDVVRFLSNLLRMTQEEADRPAIAQQPIVEPIFITGLPRSGTTFLHSLLMQDCASIVPRVWQTIYPYPERGARKDGSEPRVAMVNRQLRAFERLAPEFRSLHPLTAQSPQECSEITAHVFASLRFDTTYHVPSYREWLDGTGHLEAYRFHRRFLQHLQSQDLAYRVTPHPGAGSRRWVLKCPDHVFALDAIRSIYPDARIVFVHRDPLNVLASVAKLTEVLRRPFMRRVDAAQIGRQESIRWLAGAERMIEADARSPFAMPVHHIQYPDLVRDPLGTVERLYRHFGLNLLPETADRVRHQVQDKPNGGYGMHQYRFEDHGLDPAEQRRLFARYVDHFGIRTAAEKRPASRRAAAIENSGGRLTGRTRAAPIHRCGERGQARGAGHWTMSPRNAATPAARPCSSAVPAFAAPKRRSGPGRRGRRPACRHRPARLPARRAPRAA